ACAAGEAATVRVGMAVSGDCVFEASATSGNYTLSLHDALPICSASYAWPTTGLSNGLHTLTLNVTDGGGRTASASLAVTVANPTNTGGDTTPPTVAITSPTSGVWTGNSLDVAVTASDNVAVKTI